MKAERLEELLYWMRNDKLSAEDKQELAAFISGGCHMAAPIYRAPSLYDALKLEGFTLPDECSDVKLLLPVDGCAQLALRINLTPTNIGQIGRALARLEEGKKGPL